MVVEYRQLSSQPCYRAGDRAASLPGFPLLQVPAAQVIRRYRKGRCGRCSVTSRRTELCRCPLSPYYRFQQSERHSSASLSTTFTKSFPLSLDRQGRGGKEHGSTDPGGLSCQRRFDLAAPGHGGRLRVVPSVVEPSNHHPQWRTRTALLRGTSCTLRPHGRCHAAKKIEGYEPHPSSCA